MKAHPPMTHAGLIAAGEGSRLRASHPSVIKPLVPVAGSPLCHWVAAALAGAGMRELAVLHNSRGRAMRRSLEEAFPGLAWRFIEEDTASSWESFRLVAKTLAARTDAFLISTVDALIPPAEVRRFAHGIRATQALAGLALTDFIDDEKPLWADLGPSGLIEALGPRAVRRSLATSGLYFMTAELALGMPEASAHPSLRSYWASLLEEGIPVAGLRVSKTIDVDRPGDLLQAEGFVKDLKSPKEHPIW